jgi:hypothetical protein
LVKARVLMFVNCDEQLLVTRGSGNFELVQKFANVKMVNINDIVGHSGTSTRVSQVLITSEAHDLLNRIAEGKPGIKGPQFPRGWNRPEDVCVSG